MSDIDDARMVAPLEDRCCPRCRASLHRIALIWPFKRFNRAVVHRTAQNGQRVRQQLPRRCADAACFAPTSWRIREQLGDRFKAATRYESSNSRAWNPRNDGLRHKWCGEV